MPSQKQRLARLLKRSAVAVNPDRLVMRFIENAAPGKAVIASETPIQRYDEERKIVVSEVLLMDGVVFRNNRNQLPIVDSHNDRTVRNIFGSIRNIHIDEVNGELYGEPSFASDDDSQIIARRVEEGHITDFSITADPLETTFIPRGQSYTTRRGAVIEGPALIHTKWEPHNASICATGADVNSTVRRSYQNLEDRTERMDEALLGQLKSLGLPDGMEDPNQILAWVVGKMGTPEEEAPVVENMEEEEKPSEDPVVENMEEEEKPPVEEEIKNAVSRALKADIARRKEIQAACKAVGIERAIADGLCEEGISINVARERILQRMATNPIGQSSETIRVTGSEDNKFYGAVRDGLLLRAQQSAGVKRSLTPDKPAAGSGDFRYASLGRTAEMFARRMGAPVERMAPKDIAMVAMGHQPTLDRLRIQRSEGAFHSTGSFANLLLDAANKTLLAGYEEAEFTWNIWARTAPAVADFKNINRIRFSESPSLEMVPELGDYPEGKMSDSRESYKVEKFGSVFTVSWETIVNDDLDAISRIPAMQGDAARRTQNAKVYEVLTSNPLMGDGKALFANDHASGTNVSGAAAAPAVGTLNTGFTAMRRQKGLNTNVTLNLTPRFLIVPVEYEATALELFSSTSYNAANNNEGVRNIYGPGGGRTLTIVADAVLTSAVQWYLAADTARIDTIELAYLQGEESPVLENEWDFAKDCYRYKIRQTFGVKAIDWRGLFRNAA
jgi:hypothetical protein